MKNRNSKERKNAPVFSGVLEYFPDALMAVAELSKIGNDKHNPGQALNWSKNLSNDHGDCLVRHQLEYNKIDEDTGLPHAVSVAWRALAQLQILLEEGEDEFGAIDLSKGEFNGNHSSTGTKCDRNKPTRYVRVYL